MPGLLADIMEHGMGMVAVAAGIWMLWYLVKFTVVQLGKQIGTLTDKIKDLSSSLVEFTGHVRREHGDCTDNQKDMQENQREMTKQLGEITSALGRINGYK